MCNTHNIYKTFWGLFCSILLHDNLIISLSTNTRTFLVQQNARNKSKLHMQKSICGLCPNDKIVCQLWQILDMIGGFWYFQMKWLALNCEFHHSLGLLICWLQENQKQECDAKVADDWENLLFFSFLNIKMDFNSLLY